MSCTNTNTNYNTTKVSLFDSLEVLPTGIKVQIMRRYAELKTGQIKKELSQEIEEERNFCQKCGEKSVMLSTLGMCHGCVEYGYTKAANGMLVPNNLGYTHESSLSNNLFGLDLFV